MRTRSKVIIVAAALVAVLAGASLYGLRAWHQQDVLDRIGDEVAAKIASHEGLLKERFFTDPDFRKYAPDFEKYSETLIGGEYFRVKIWNASLTVLWSDDPTLIGRNYPNKGEALEAIDEDKAGVEFITEIDQDVRSEFIGEKSHLPFVEVYVPVHFSGKVAGLVELYRDAGDVPLEVDARMKLPTIAIAALAFAIMAALLRSAKRTLQTPPAAQRS